MTLLFWNIQRGGGARLARIMEEVSAYDADVVALTEFRVRPGADLQAAMLHRGWPYVETSNPAGNQDGIAIFSRTPMTRNRPSTASPDDQVRWLDVELPEYTFGMAVLHIMAATNSALGQAKAQFWEGVLQAAETRVHQPYLFGGDWNTGAHGLDEKGKTFVCAQHFAKLAALGFTDLWRRHHPGTTEFTWYSKLKGGARGNGFRVDHAFASPSLQQRVTSCRYSHVEREAGISAHSLLLLEVAD